ncbi:MAG: TonB-dependent receptor [Bacteroidales bacterium]|nr:TonB-dependent receptor [Bacteroidales bacterium]
MKNIFFRVLQVLVVLMLLGQAASGQNGPGQGTPVTGVITGQVKDQSTGDPMEYASVVIFRGMDSTMVDGTVTGPDGRFIMEGIPPGRYFLVANFIGYDKTIVGDIRITPDQKVFDAGIMMLSPASTALRGVEVVADKDHVEYRIDKKIVNVSQDIVAVGGSAVSVLENVPSVSVDIEGNVSLRGSSSFQVLIDGKPSVIEGSDALQQIPASQIDHIEIITNPSAKYDPDGVGGIINVITKKQKQPGMNGVVNGSIATGNKYKLDVLLNQRMEKLNVFGGVDVNYRDFEMEGESEYRTDVNDTVTFQDSWRNGLMNRKGFEVKGGANYNISGRTDVSLTGSVGGYGFGRDMTSRRVICTDPFMPEEYSKSVSGSERKGGFYRLDAGYSHRFNEEGRKIDALVFYSERTGGDTDFQEDYITNPDWTTAESIPESLRTSEDDSDRDLRIKADLVFPFGKEQKLEAGVQSHFMREHETYTFEDFDNSLGSWVENEMFSDASDFMRDIHAVYVIAGGESQSWGYQAGLRGEYTHRRIQNEKSAEPFVIDRLDLFPSVHLSRSFEKDYQVMASYSRRIERPRGWDLNPFPNYMDAYNIRIGNPGLEPEYIDSYELGIQKRYNGSFVSLEAYHRLNKNKITRIKTLQEDGTFLHTHLNLNRDYSTGAELMLNLFLSRQFQLNTSATVYDYRLEGSVEEEDVTRSSTNWNTRTNFTAKFRWDIRLQLTGIYEGPSATAQGDREGFFVFNAAVRKDLLNQKLNMTLSVQDLFATGKREMVSTGQGFYSYDHFRREAPVLTLNISYLINNYRKERETNSNGQGQQNDMEMDMGM